MTDIHQQRHTERDVVWGVAYHIIPSKVEEVKEYLDIREMYATLVHYGIGLLTSDSNGYSIQYTPFHPADSSLASIHCLVYIGMPDNPQFLGVQAPQDIADTINTSVGPSGENREYLLHLEQALEELCPDSHDEHITDLARRVRALTPPLRESSRPPAHDNALRKVRSTEEQEEIEKEG
ncbi:Cation transport regulator-like protein 2 [Cladophialophora carrionii]|uniref:glutathione-specific gamma-glutamylcyclotransferase n=1 Tax=Cladophialophora carrionii TaxID=86049 RepID=A0A1C1CLG7_9EURO|nr:Cation transport regulator-like protein 2 [Cladophialophora carrionii]